MKNILIISDRTEVNKLFELLLWHTDRRFSKANSIERGLELFQQRQPNLIIVDIRVAPQNRCLELCTWVKSSPEHAGTPLLLVCEPQQNDTEFKELLDTVDGVLPEPFSPNEIKSTTELYI